MRPFIYLALLLAVLSLALALPYQQHELTTADSLPAPSAPLATLPEKPKASLFSKFKQNTKKAASATKSFFGNATARISKTYGALKECVKEGSLLKFCRASNAPVQVEKPVKQRVKAPVVAPMVTPVSPVATPIMAPTVAPVETPVQEAVKQIVQEPEQETVHEPVQEAAKVVIEEPVQKAVEEPVQKPVVVAVNKEKHDDLDEPELTAFKFDEDDTEWVSRDRPAAVGKSHADLDAPVLTAFKNVPSKRETPRTRPECKASQDLSTAIANMEECIRNLRKTFTGPSKHEGIDHSKKSPVAPRKLKDEEHKCIKDYRKMIADPLEHEDIDYFEKPPIAPWEANDGEPLKSVSSRHKTLQTRSELKDTSTARAQTAKFVKDLKKVFADPLEDEDIDHLKKTPVAPWEVNDEEHKFATLGETIARTPSWIGGDRPRKHVEAVAAKNEVVEESSKKEFGKETLKKVLADTLEDEDIDHFEKPSVAPWEVNDEEPLKSVPTAKFVKDHKNVFADPLEDEDIDYFEKPPVAPWEVNDEEPKFVTLGNPTKAREPAWTGSDGLRRHVEPVAKKEFVEEAPPKKKIGEETPKKTVAKATSQKDTVPKEKKTVKFNDILFHPLFDDLDSDIEVDEDAVLAPRPVEKLSREDETYLIPPRDSEIAPASMPTTKKLSHKDKTYLIPPRESEITPGSMPTGLRVPKHPEHFGNSAARLPDRKKYSGIPSTPRISASSTGTFESKIPAPPSVASRIPAVASKKSAGPQVDSRKTAAARQVTPKASASMPRRVSAPQAASPRVPGRVADRKH